MWYAVWCMTEMAPGVCQLQRGNEGNDMNGFFMASMVIQAQQINEMTCS